MNFGRGMKRRPNRGQMLDYAESLVDHKPLPAHVAGAIKRNDDAATEVDAIRETLAFMAEVPELEPSNDLTRAILLEARAARQPKRQAAYRRASALQAVVRGTVYTAAMSFVCLVVFSAAVYQPATDAATATDSPAQAMEVRAAATPGMLTPGLLQQKAREVRTLTAVVGRESGDASTSPIEWRHLRSVSAVDNDITAALEALERNPGGERATKIVYSSLERKAESLREFYVDRNL